MRYKYSEVEIFPEQAASDANLTATGGYFLDIFNKKTPSSLWDWDFFLVQLDLVITVI